ncbi:MAG: hypothetical protein KatS3mg003_1623 [Candidatus Nitrosocaldaceae archaeon]|nr:MAG: hypothetical protein KatS3mg003_0405 [Candidatus Nitrosocaldaceae archaeon]GIU72144.1 MAG: hypothetical protein KatS3mg003_1623 [Candidatus Nitrosocaldaceae archaeon]
MNKYLKIIDKQLSKDIEMNIDIKEFADNRLDYIHGLDLFTQKRVKNRVKNKNVISAIVDNSHVTIRINKNKIRYACSNDDNICKHILATLIAFEKEPNTFIDRDDKIRKIIHAHKMLVDSIKNNTLDEDIELLHDLHELIIAHNDNASHIIGLIILSILMNIDNKYNANTIKIINELFADNINAIKNVIKKDEKKDMARSWDNIITELINRVG